MAQFITDTAGYFGFLAAVLGIITAIINLRRGVRNGETTSPPSTEPRRRVTVGKRCKRFLLSAGLFALSGFVFANVAIGAMGGASPEWVVYLFLVLTLFFVSIAAYQFAAMVILILVRIWR